MSRLLRLQREIFRGFHGPVFVDEGRTLFGHRLVTVEEIRECFGNELLGQRRLGCPGPRNDRTG